MFLLIANMFSSRPSLWQYPLYIQNAWYICHFNIKKRPCVIYPLIFHLNTSVLPAGVFSSDCHLVPVINIQHSTPKRKDPFNCLQLLSHIGRPCSDTGSLLVRTDVDICTRLHSEIRKNNTLQQNLQMVWGRARPQSADCSGVRENIASVARSSINRYTILSQLLGLSLLYDVQRLWHFPVQTFLVSEQRLDLVPSIFTVRNTIKYCTEAIGKL